MDDSTPPPPSRPVRVLNLIDGLSGGGSEKLLWNTILLSDPSQVKHWVATASPDWFGDFHYAARLRAAGAYPGGSARRARTPRVILRLFGALRKFMRAPNPYNPIFSFFHFFLQIATIATTFPRSVAAVIRFRPDVIHTHTFYSFVHGVFLALILRVRVVHTVPCLFAQMPGAGFGWLPRFYRWSAHATATYFTGASVTELRSAGIPADRIVPISGGLDLASVHAARADRPARRAAARRRFGLPPDALVALNIGRLHESKGQAFALAAVARLAPQFSNLHLLILGEGELRSSLSALADSLGIADRVHLAGFCEEPLDGCAAADIYLRTNLLEGDNLSSLQALDLGLPVAGFATGREIDVVRSVGSGVLVPVGDGDALAEAVRHLLSLPDRGAALGRAGAAHIDAHLGIENLLQAYNSAYRRSRAEGTALRSRLKTTALWFAKFAVTGLILAFVLTRMVDWSTLIRAATLFPLAALALMLGFNLATRWVIAWQTGLALTHAGIPLRTGRVFHLHLITSFFSVVLPGELAGAAVSWHLFSRDSGRRAQTAAALIYLRLIGLFMLVLVGAVGLLVEPRLLALHAQWALVIVGAGVGLPLLSFHFRAVARILKRFTDIITDRLPFVRLRSASASFWSSVDEFTSLSLGMQGAIWLAAVLAYLLNVAAGLVAMQGALVHAPATAIIWLLASVTLMSLVPFTIAGFGIREVGVAALLKRWYGVPTESAVLFSLAIGVSSIVAAAGFGGLALLFELFQTRRKTLVLEQPSAR